MVEYDVMDIGFEYLFHDILENHRCMEIHKSFF